MARILVVEDEEHSVQALARYLGDNGHRVVTAARASEALDRAAKLHPEVLLTDLFLLGDRGGDEVARELLEADPGLKVIVMSGLPEPEVARRIEGLEIHRLCLKPFSLTEIGAAVDDALAVEV